MRVTRFIGVVVLACVAWSVQAHSQADPLRQLAKGLKLLEAKDYSGAFDIFEKIDPGGDKQLKARTEYLGGYALFKSGMPDEASALLSRAADDLLMGDYALAHLARIYSEAASYRKVIKTVDRISSLFPYSPLHDEMAIVKAKALEETGKRDKAIKLLNKLVSSKPAIAHEALWILAANLEQSGSLDEAYKTYQKIFYRYPHTPLAETARNETVRMYKTHLGKFRQAPPPEKLKRVEILIKNKKYADAEIYIRSINMSKLGEEMRGALLIQLAKALDRLNSDREAIKVYRRIVHNLHGTDSRPLALYYMARMEWNRGNDLVAAELMNRLIAEYPEHEKTPAAYYVSGRIDENNGDHESALKKWMEAVNLFPESDIAPTCLWSAGWRYYLREDYKEAQRIFVLFIEKYPESAQLKKALYWHGRSLLKIGERGEAALQFERLMTEFPNSYYALLQSNDTNNNLYTHMIRFHPNEDRLDEIVNREIIAQLEKYQRRPELNIELYWALKAALNWLALGFRDRARPLLDLVAAEVEQTNGHIIWISYLYYRAGFYSDMIWRLNMVASDPQLDDGERRFLTMVMYPVTHWQTILLQAEKYNVDPLLVLAVIRQESRFDADIVSSADARGLMQIIPPTGKRISKALEMEDYSDEQLHTPDINIKMGVFYLASLLRRSEEELAPALASYNAGIRVVRKWLTRLSYDDMTEFVETIPYPETRGYVKKVLRNYGVYQDIYYKALRTETASQR